MDQERPVLPLMHDIGFFFCFFFLSRLLTVGSIFNSNWFNPPVSPFTGQYVSWSDVWDTRYPNILKLCILSIQNELSHINAQCIHQVICKAVLESLCGPDYAWWQHKKGNKTENSEEDLQGKEDIKIYITQCPQLPLIWWILVFDPVEEVDGNLGLIYCLTLYNCYLWKLCEMWQYCCREFLS